MTDVRETRDTAREKQEAGATSGGIQYAKAPSMIWFILPMAALLAYGFLSR